MIILDVPHTQIPMSKQSANTHTYLAPDSVVIWHGTNVSTALCSTEFQKHPHPPPYLCVPDSNLCSLSDTTAFNYTNYKQLHDTTHACPKACFLLPPHCAFHRISKASPTDSYHESNQIPEFMTSGTTEDNCVFWLGLTI